MQSDIDLRSLLGIVRRQLWLILSIVVGLTALAAIITYSLEPRYSASAQVFVDTAAKGILDADEPTRNSGSDNARVDTEVVITRTDEILLSVINSENLVADDEFGVKISLTDRALQLLRLKSAAAPEPEEAAADVLDNFRDSVRVSRRGMTYVIDVTVTSEDPEKAARLANAVAKASIQKQMDTKVAAIREARDRVQPALEQARQTLTSTSRSIDTFIDRNIELLREQGSPSVGMFNDELTRIRSQRERDFQRLQTLDQTIRQNDYASLFQNLQSDAARELQQRQEELAGQSRRRMPMRRSNCVPNCSASPSPSATKLPCNGPVPWPACNGRAAGDVDPLEPAQRRDGEQPSRHRGRGSLQPCQSGPEREKEL